MTKASDNVFPRLLVSEGGSTATPAAGNVTVYAKADGLLYSKDDAGAETALGGGGGGSVATDTIWDAAGDLAVGSGADTAARLAIGAAGGALSVINSAVAWNSGTAFPASKATGDRYWRTDLGREFYWDGTRWATTQEFSLNTTTRTAQTASGLAASQASLDNAATPGTVCLITTFRVVTFVQTTNDGTKYWTVELNALAPDNTPTQLGQTSTGTAPDALSTWTQHDVAVNTAVTSASGPVLRVGATKVSTPGTLILSWDIRYRLVAT